MRQQIITISFYLRFLGLNVSPPPRSSSRSDVSLLPVTINILRFIFLSYNCPPPWPYSLSSPTPLFFQFIISFFNISCPPSPHNLTVACTALHCTGTALHWYCTDTALHRHCNALALHCTGTALHCIALYWYCTALVLHWHCIDTGTVMAQHCTGTTLHCHNTALDCTALVLHCIGTALVLHCIGTALHWHCTALHWHCTALALHCTGTALHWHCTGTALHWH